VGTSFGMQARSSRGQVEEASLAEIMAGGENAACDALGLGVAGALDRARPPWLFRQCWLSIPAYEASSISRFRERENGAEG
jgi:hypothetical protein